MRSPPGAAFGMDSWLRINICKEPKELRAALEALGKEIDGFLKKQRSIRSHAFFSDHPENNFWFRQRRA
ncbi:MAG: hypothetical protein L6Q71_11815 [Planctomycetes bacterium]|nr:hypothetical protein [Planctomycetota bacterium]